MPHKSEVFLLIDFWWFIDKNFLMIRNAQIQGNEYCIKNNQANSLLCCFLVAGDDDPLTRGFILQMAIT